MTGCNKISLILILPCLFTQLPQDKEIGYEPWHISYLPIAQQAQQQFNADILCEAWQQ
ncbi:hypothetical protein AAUPMC_10802, partial [Pasteurella multocida subsp. multocida str. Anand1_cattle]